MTGFELLLFLIPAVAGGIVAALNSDAANDTTERIEAWVRLQRGRLSSSEKWYIRYVINPVLLVIVQFSNWTDGLQNRGTKNGLRIAAALYSVAFWLFLIYVAVVVVVTIVILGVCFYVAAKVLEGFAENSTSRSERSAPVRGSTSYSKTGMFSEDETGRTDEEGLVFKKTGMFTEEEVGRVAEDGTFYNKTGMFSEEESGRTDADGRIFWRPACFQKRKSDVSTKMEPCTTRRECSAKRNPVALKETRTRKVAGEDIGC